MTRPAILAALLLAVCATGAAAQTGSNYNIPGMNFDMWCQEQAHLPPDRCDKRTAEDDKAFEAFRQKVDQYEIPYLQEQQHELAIHRDIMQSDPVDNPISQDPQAQTQDPNRQPLTPAP